jgi:hypothetical protein
VLVSVAALTVALGGVAYATIPDSSGVIHGCYQKNVGNLRVINSPSHGCRPSEVALNWNQTGPTGATGATGTAGATGSQGPTGPQGTLPGGRMWINPLDFLAGDPSVKTSFNAVTSGVGGGLSGLIIESTTIGDEASGGGNKVVERGLDVPPGYRITGVRVCYELSNTRSFIDQIRLAQVRSAWPRFKNRPKKPSSNSMTRLIRTPRVRHALTASRCPGQPTWMPKRARFC